MGISMFTTNGDLVPKTEEGLNVGQFPTLDKRAINFQWDKYNCQCAVLSPDWDVELFHLDPIKYFDIKAPGRYKLQVSPRIYIIDTNANLKPIELPAITVDVQVNAAPSGLAPHD
jgi:hypothetical protein